MLEIARSRIRERKRERVRERESKILEVVVLNEFKAIFFPKAFVPKQE